MLDPKQLRAVLRRAVLRIQDALSDPDKAMKLAAGIRLKLGEIFVESGKVLPEQLEDALLEQSRTGEKLGAIMIRRGWFGPALLGRALEFQGYQSMEKSEDARLRLGEILVATGDITRAQLDDALARQRRSGKQLGAELVDAGYLKPAQLTSGLHLQRMLVSAAMAVALACETLAGSAPAEAAETASARVTVSATVLRHASVRVLSAPRTVSISEADIARGYVDVPVPSRLEIRSNSPSGYIIAIESAADFVRGTEVRRLDDVVSFGPFGGVLNVKGGRARHECDPC